MKKIIVLVIFFILVLGIQFSSTYGLFESNLDIKADSELAKWQININNLDINGSTKTFIIDNISYSEDENVLNNRLAPSTEAYFDIIINPKNTEVSVRYDIELDLSSLENSEIKLKNIEETNGSSLIKTGSNTYTGIITYDNITKNTIYDIKVTLVWNNNEDNNSEDYQTGTQSNRTISIPVKIDISQYLNEDIIEYQQSEGV